MRDLRRAGPLAVRDQQLAYIGYRPDHCGHLWKLQPILGLALVLQPSVKMCGGTVERPGAILGAARLAMHIGSLCRLGQTRLVFRDQAGLAHRQHGAQMKQEKSTSAHPGMQPSVENMPSTANAVRHDLAVGPDQGAR